jgi:hypothetical protein
MLGADEPLGWRDRVALDWFRMKADVEGAQ